MSRIDRRQFFRNAATLSGSAIFAPSLAGLTRWNAASATEVADRIAQRQAMQSAGGYGELVRSTTHPEFMIPRDFKLVRISETHMPSVANEMFIVPAAVDGMATFALPNGNVRLIRNHEIVDGAAFAKPFGRKPYDLKGGGGTTLLEVRVVGRGNELAVTVIKEYPSITGTIVNCAGGPTPWKSWLTCEETTNGLAQGYTKPHGYVFEVPASATEEVEAVPLKAMGRFKHEAVAVDPGTGFVYLTEDLDLGTIPRAGFYRFIPKTPAKLADGGKLQILAIRNSPGFDTSLNQPQGVVYPVYWIDVDDPDPPEAEAEPSTVFLAAVDRGAARFQRLEGCFWGDSSVFFDSTSGGNARSGQIWQYRPTSRDAGELRLVFESPSSAVLDKPDNICISPRGGIVICEDSGGEQFLRGLLKTGEIINLVHATAERGRMNPSEFAGSCMSPDGRILFFNQQGSTRSTGGEHGGTYALWGPWERGGL